MCLSKIINYKNIEERKEDGQAILVIEAEDYPELNDPAIWRSVVLHERKFNLIMFYATEFVHLEFFISFAF